MKNGQYLSETIAKFLFVSCILSGVLFGWKGPFITISIYFISIFGIIILLKKIGKYNNFKKWMEKEINF